MQTTLAPIRRLSNWLRTGPASRSERPPNVSWLLEHLKERAEAPALTAGRTPTASLYRMYEYIVVGFTMGLRTEIEFFFNQGPTWAVSSIPDPEDPDPQRYVILSVLPFYLCKAFNRLIERGLPRGSPAIIAGDAELEELRSRPIVLEKEPEWAAKVPALAERVVLPGPDGCEPPEETWSKGFWRRISRPGKAHAHQYH
ncbi:hypothetical protein F5B17DRAFT_445616 [Nemania serpens]|nr:hypothetical protein F5B17DRAFT_445616 [Nemania serpens]